MPEATDEELGLDPQQMEQLDPGIRAELRKSRQLTRDNAGLQAEIEATRREAAMAKAGIPTDTPLGEMFAKSYDGDTSDPSAIKASFESLGVPLTAATAGTPAAPVEPDLTGERQVANLGTGPKGTGSVDFRDALLAADSEAEVMALIREAPEGAVSLSPGTEGYRIAVPQID